MKNISIAVLIFTLTYPIGAILGQGSYGTQFRHIVNESNSANISTYLDHPEINGNPDAIIFASSNMKPNDVVVGDHVTMFFDTDSAKWTIRNSDGENPLPIGAAFNVLIPSTGGQSFTLTSPGGSTIGMNHPSTNGSFSKEVFIMPLHPANGHGRLVASYLPGPLNTWAVSTIPATESGHTFNIFVANHFTPSFVHRVTESNSPITEIDHPRLNGDPYANFIFQRQFNFSNGASTTHNFNRKSADYINGKWHIRIDFGNTFHVNEDYSIAITTGISGHTCSLPRELNCGDVIQANTTGVTNDNATSNPTFCSGEAENIGTGGQYWYKISAPDGDLSVNFSTCETIDFSPEIRVYSGSCGEFTCVGTAAGNCVGSEASEISVAIPQGETYFIRVGGLEGTEGNFELSVVCQSPVSTDDSKIADQLVEVFPNPVHNDLNIRWNNSAPEATIYELHNISGKLILSGLVAPSDLFTLDLSGIPNGIFFLKLRRGNQIADRKVVVSR